MMWSQNKENTRARHAARFRDDRETNAVAIQKIGKYHLKSHHNDGKMI